MRVVLQRRGLGCNCKGMGILTGMAWRLEWQCQWNWKSGWLRLCYAMLCCAMSRDCVFGEGVCVGLRGGDSGFVLFKLELELELWFGRSFARANVTCLQVNLQSATFKSVQIQIVCLFITIIRPLPSAGSSLSHKTPEHLRFPAVFGDSVPCFVRPGANSTCDVVLMLHDATGLCNSVFDMANHLHNGPRATSQVAEAIREHQEVGEAVLFGWHWHWHWHWYWHRYWCYQQ